MAIIRLTILGTLELTGALHIGSGGAGTAGTTAWLSDDTVVRDSSGCPYIPGSSLRGLLRALVGQIGPELGLSEIREDHEIRRVVSAAIDAKRAATGRRSWPTNADEKDFQDLLDCTLTPAERLFGTVWWASPLYIPDLMAHDPDVLGSEVRHSVAIDQDTRAARDGAKYDFEVLPQGMRFPFKATLEIEDVAQEKAAEWRLLLALGLRLLQLDEQKLGGKLARGIGQIKLQHLEVTEVDFSNRTQFLTLLRSVAIEPETDSNNWPMRQLEGVA